MAKDIQIKYKNEQKEWEELYPKTKTRNITDDKGESQEEINENLTAQLAQKADQDEVNTIAGQIDNLVANAGDTDGNAELLDIRIGWDGVIYPTAGDAVRSIQQFMTEENKLWRVN